MPNMSNSKDEIRSQIKVISECFVKPKYQVEASKQPYYLGPLDLWFLTIDQIQKGLLFSTKPKNITSHFLYTLKNSLAVALVHFYPLSGQLSTKVFPNENAKWTYLDCTKGPGARLVHASVDDTVSNILASVDVHPIVESLFGLGEKSTNYDGHNRPLLSVQVTELIDGVFIGFTMNHSVVDGTSQWHFINTLSEIFLHQLDINTNTDTISISQNPMFQPYFANGHGHVIKVPILNPKEPEINIIRNDVVPFRVRIFHFSSVELSKLKAKANQECQASDNTTTVVISSFQALSGLMWRSITRARNLRPELETMCALVMNARPRISPPLSNDYFGNIVIKDQSVCNVGLLLSKGLGWAAMLLHQVVNRPNDKSIRTYLDGLEKSISQAPDNSGTGMDTGCPNMVLIGGSARFDMYGPEFGLGKAEAVLAGYCNREDGKITVSPGREGGGSVDLEVCLKHETMNALELDEEFMSFVTL